MRTRSPRRLPAHAAPQAFNSRVATAAMGNLATPVAGLATGPLLALGLGVDGRGLVAAGTAPLFFALALGTFGLPEAVTYFTSRSTYVDLRLLRFALLLILAIGAVLTVLSIRFSGLLTGHTHSAARLVLLASLFIVPNLLLSVLRGMAAALDAWSAIARDQLISALLRLVGVLALAVSGHLDPATATVVIALTTVVGVLAYREVVLAMFASATAGRFAVDQPPRISNRDAASYGMRIWIGYLGGIVLLRLDQLVMAPLAGIRQLGIYVVAVTVAEVLLIVGNSFRDVTFAVEAAGQAAGQIASAARVAGAATAAAGLFLIFASPFLITTFFGRAFGASLGPLWVLIVAIVLITPGSVAGAGLSARGRPGLRSGSLVFAAVVNAGLLILLAPRYGAMGAAIATLFGNVTFGSVNILLLSRISENRVRDFLGLRGADLQSARTALHQLPGPRSRASATAGG